MNYRSLPSAEVFWYNSSSIVVHQFLNDEVSGCVFLGSFIRYTQSIMALVETICRMNILK